GGSQDGDAGPVRTKKRAGRERMKIELAPDQPATTQGKPRERVYVACLQWYVPTPVHFFLQIPDFHSVEVARFAVTVRNPCVTTAISVPRGVVNTTQFQNDADQ